MDLKNNSLNKEDESIKKSEQIEKENSTSTTTLITTTTFLNKKTNRDNSEEKKENKHIIKIEKLNLIMSKAKDKNINAEITKKLAFDCEMVEINKLHSGLARISVVNEHGEIIIDTFCKPPGDITDYRYDITGLTPSDFEKALEFEECRKLILKLFKNKILIGHSVENDFLALNYEHPKNLLRDTSKFKHFRNKINQPYSLKYLTETHLKKEIQSSTHDSIEDARAALCLYKLYEEEIEKDLLNKNHKLVRKNVIEDSKKLHVLFGI